MKKKTEKAGSKYIQGLIQKQAQSCNSVSNSCCTMLQYNCRNCNTNIYLLISSFSRVKSSSFYFSEKSLRFLASYYKSGEMGGAHFFPKYMP